MVSPELKQLEDDILLKAEFCLEEDCLDKSDVVENDDEVGGLLDNIRETEDGFTVDFTFKFKLVILDAGGGIGSTGFGRIIFEEEEASCTCRFPVARVTDSFIC